MKLPNTSKTPESSDREAAEYIVGHASGRHLIEAIAGTRVEARTVEAQACAALAKTAYDSALLTTGDPLNKMALLVNALEQRATMCPTCRCSHKGNDYCDDAFHNERFATGEETRMASMIRQRDAALEAALQMARRADIMREALEIVAGLRQCADNLMSNVDVARAALGNIK